MKLNVSLHSQSTLCLHCGLHPEQVHTLRLSFTHSLSPTMEGHTKAVEFLLILEVLQATIHLQSKVISNQRTSESSQTLSSHWLVLLLGSAEQPVCVCAPPAQSGALQHLVTLHLFAQWLRQCCRPSPAALPLHLLQPGSSCFGLVELEEREPKCPAACRADCLFVVVLVRCLL